MATRDDMKREAIKRMKKLDIHPECIKAFEEQGEVWASHFQGILYELDEEQKNYISEFEEEWGGLAYHVIITPTEIGTMFSILYVSKHEEEWEMDNEDLEDDMYLTPIVYVKNLDDDICSEFGSIGIEKRHGGLIRTA